MKLSPFKTLIFIKGEEIPDNWLNEDQESIHYDHPDELPFEYDKAVYGAFLFVVSSIEFLELEYIQKLRIAGNLQPVYIIYELSTLKLLDEFIEISDCVLFHKSSKLKNSFRYISKLLNLAVQKRTDWLAKEKKYKNFFNNNPHPALLISRQGTIRNLNPAFIKTYVFEQDELTQKPVWDILPGFEKEFSENETLKTGRSFEGVVTLKSGILQPCKVDLVSSGGKSEEDILVIVQELSRNDVIKKQLEMRNDTFVRFEDIIEKLSQLTNLDTLPAWLKKHLQVILKSDSVFLIRKKDKNSAIHLNTVPEIFRDFFQKHKVRIENESNLIDLQIMDFSASRGNNIKSVLSIPLRTGGNYYGVLFSIYYNDYRPDFYSTYVARFVAQLISVTLARLKSIREINASEHHFKMLVENAQDGIYQSSKEGELLYANQALIDLLGYNSLQELQQIDIAKSLYKSPGARKKLLEELDLKKIVRNYPVSLRTKNGKNISVVENAHIIEKADGSPYYEGVIRDLTDIIGLEQTGFSEATEIDPRHLMDQVVTLFEKTCEENIKIIQDNRLYESIKADHYKLSQAFYNIAINSVEAMTEGGTLTFSSQAVKAANISGFPEKEKQVKLYAQFCISDTGTGISQENMPKVFEPFFTTKKGNQHKGLGLTLARKIIKKQNGHISLISTAGEGTKVQVYLPLLEKSETLKAQGHKKKVLIIDDEAIIRDLLEDVLGNEGLDVVCAEDGKTGLDLYKKYIDEIGLILLDVILPGMDGQEVLCQLKKINPDIKILIISGFSKANVKDKLIAEGVVGFIQKPFSIVHLTETVKQTLNLE